MVENVILIMPLIPNKNELTKLESNQTFNVIVLKFWLLTIILGLNLTMTNLKRLVEPQNIQILSLFDVESRSFEKQSLKKCSIGFLKLMMTETF